MNFSTFITEEKNTHMTHIEDKVIYGGVKGTRDAIMALRSLRDMLGGKHAGNVSVKWDGAPAVFCGTDPRDGRFFVAKKGIFNKSPKVYKSDADIDADASGDLADKLKLALKYLPELGIKGVVQGDFLYSKSDIKTKKIDGKAYVTFHPNTIVYAVPAGTEMAKQIKATKIGIVWHTTYTGKSFETMKASYGVKVNSFNQSKNVWSQDAMLRDMTKYTMSKKETDQVNDYLKTAGYIFNRIAGSTLRQLENNQDLAKHIETHANSYVRAGALPPDPKKRVDALIKFISNKYQKEIDSRKTDKGKAAQQKKLNDILAFFSNKNRQSLIQMFELQKVIVLAKLKLINTLNRLNSVSTFLKTKKGYRVTGQEGYVAIDKLGGDAVKIVDRMEFSYANFSPNILKGWDKPGRN
ncbi:MAG: hypothetical protein CMO44_13720 [Verrucomicrobiales bacterium]|nr:hypothetical protein [Verrucomicrobiales bacterium]|tara:strand:- start:2007 stop:3233 length:1227 start_codon:yes stop_codon:yes gene_type:complete